MDTYKAINDILVHLFNEIWELEEKAIITEEYKDITNNDMHIIEAIGLGEGNNMSTIAKKLNITVGSLSSFYEILRDDGMLLSPFPSDGYTPLSDLPHSEYALYTSSSQGYS